MRLERELGIRRGDQEIAALVARLEVTATHARLLLRLYSAGGRPVPFETLLTVLSTHNLTYLTVTICAIRKIVGDGFIGTGPQGTSCYHLTAKGLAGVLAALEPVEVQDASTV